MSVEALQEQAAAQAPRSRFALFRPLAQRDFRLLWIGQTVSMIGDQFHFIALAWLVLQLTGSALALGTVLTAAAVPRGVLMLVGGAITDRFSPRRLMLLSDSMRAVLVGLLSALVLTGSVRLWHLYVLAAIFGAIDALFYPASTTIVPMIVEEDQLTAATAFGQISQAGSSFVGPALAGAMIVVMGHTAGIGYAFVVDAATFLVSALSLVLMRSGMRAPQAVHTQEPPSNLLQSIQEGLRYVWRDPVLRAVLVIVAALNLTTNGVFGVGLPILARVHFSGGAAAYGAISAGFGGGALIGVAIAGSIRLPRRRGWMTVGVTAGFGLFALLMPFMPNVPSAVILMALVAIGGGLINTVMIPWLQTRSDPDMLGRVMSLVMLAAIGLTPLSFAAAGWIASISVTLLFLIGGGIILATAAGALSSRAVRTID